MYSASAEAARRCTAARKDGLPCRAWALWDDPRQLCLIHAGRGRRGPQLPGDRPQRPTAYLPCTCAAYHWPHRPGGGLCRWPDAPEQRRPGRAAGRACDAESAPVAIVASRSVAAHSSRTPCQDTGAACGWRHRTQTLAELGRSRPMCARVGRAKEAAPADASVMATLAPRSGMPGQRRAPRHPRPRRRVRPRAAGAGAMTKSESSKHAWQPESSAPAPE